jgi:hypothetical protein
MFPALYVETKLPLKKAGRRAKKKKSEAAEAQGKNKQFEEEKAIE